jgi:hypothetical protein
MNGLILRRFFKNTNETWPNSGVFNRLCGFPWQWDVCKTLGMESHEVLRRALRKTSPKAVAADLGVSLSLVYKWAEKPSNDTPGSKNPLDRLLQIIELSGDNGIIDWLCRHQGGFFVKDPDVGEHQIDHVLPATQEIIGKFSDLLTQITDAAEDHSVSRKDADEIREVWDQLKSYAEAFVRACEAGNFKEMSHHD